MGRKQSRTSAWKRVEVQDEGEQPYVRFGDRHYRVQIAGPGRRVNTWNYTVLEGPDQGRMGTGSVFYAAEAAGVGHATKMTKKRRAAKRKSPSQLDREIGSFLRSRSKRAHSTKTNTALQLMETAQTQKAAKETLAGIARLDGYLGGRILPPSPQKPGWRVQAFLEDDGAKDLPHGMRRVVIPAGQRAALGIR